MNINKYIDPFYFLLAITIGMLFVYTTLPVPDVIIKYPTPENAGKVIYRDVAYNCYTYEADNVTCPQNEFEIKDITVQGVEIEKKNTESICQLGRDI